MAGSIFSDLLAAWHIFRIPLFIGVAITFVAIRAVSRLRASREKLSSSPAPSSPALDSKKEAPQEWIAPNSLDEKTVSRENNNAESSAAEPISEKEVPIKKKTDAAPKRVTGTKRSKSPKSNGADTPRAPFKVQPLVFYASLTASTQKSAEGLFEVMKTALAASSRAERFLEPQLHDLSYIDYDDFFIAPPKIVEDEEAEVLYFYMILLPTYNIDTTLDPFLDHLQETHHDFRIDTAPLSPLLGYSVFGFGDKEGWPTEEDGFCSQARQVDKWMAKLTGRKRAFPLGMGDVKSDSKERLEEWRLGVQEALADIVEKGGLGEGVSGSGDPVESDEEEEEEEADAEVEAEADGSSPGDSDAGAQAKLRVKRRRNKAAAVDDLEDLGSKLRKSDENNNNAEQDSSSDAPLAVDFTTYGKKKSSGSPSATAPTAKEMVPKTSPTYASLTKQGYTIVGSHSGVKICRWTKSALRGRGSCYKFSFYGIKSHLCMETTPSLSCSNKCIFCWRHGTNPVGTTWRWKVDPPEMIFDGVKEGHYKKIKMMKGVPGVRAERFQEAMRIRHCALSLVGEPIFYPHINEFTRMLHNERISSFLVCNAQHPDQLAALEQVTQLYVSIDASNRDALRRIDRPLHRDFWERFQRCLDILREHRSRQRTVFRLTLVKGFNIDEEVTGYADLVERGIPCFVEIKGVTYCGTSDSSRAGLTMQNVPFYEEIKEFVIKLDDELRRRGLSYGIAAEHAHSCCILLASTNFRINGRWHTLIDYDRFFDLLAEGKPFGPEDYIGPPTPEWATWGHGGFDPADTRVFRKGKNRKDASEAGETGESVVNDAVDSSPALPGISSAPPTHTAAETETCGSADTPETPSHSAPRAGTCCSSNSNSANGNKSESKSCCRSEEEQLEEEGAATEEPEFHANSTNVVVNTFA
ncbi:hypothetical protein L228DRAFT_285757 [Xylona heveae TC161]|uniref:S-adenosyl-L-methionine-dependent tRNA 4-demethylwyosine synthase n=1 Tax=Xylona heveae (strain CBS 132557 / TC161) TaxID=1328760 RepID=A0A164ZNY7_XYLHT|nr:hypothetical protein L228DRAFT_285757 [Xylona heveae TC161]KZF19327.1 hypothetical protein L228DRAFT_285757 [Xylona heveae TC161]